MESQLDITLPCSLGDKLYALKEFEIKEYKVMRIKVQSSISDMGDYHKFEIQLQPMSSTGATFSIEEKDLGSKYFFDKKDIIKKVADQL